MCNKYKEDSEETSGGIKMFLTQISFIKPLLWLSKQTSSLAHLTFKIIMGRVSEILL